MNEELYELNVIDKPFSFPDEFQVIWKSQTCRINSFINRWETFNLWIWHNSLFLNFMWMWKNLGYFSWCMKRQYIFTWLSFTKEFRGLSLLMEWEGWIGKIIFLVSGELEVKWGQVFLHHLTFNLTYVLAYQRKKSHPLDPGLSTLTIRPLCLK